MSPKLFFRNSACSSSDKPDKSTLVSKDTEEIVSSKALT